jgi:hypothetical protein
MFAKIGPGWNSNSRVSGLQIERPVTSVGWRSGVHWMRDTDASSMLPARARASTVLAVPGTSSRSTWPPQAKAAITRRTACCLPTTTVSTFARIRSATAAPASTGSAGMGVAPAPGVLIRDLVEAVPSGAS